MSSDLKLLGVATKGPNDMEAVTIHQVLKCAGCGLDCTRHHFACDQSDEVWCPPCFAETACGQEAHGEGCPTQVFSDSAT